MVLVNDESSEGLITLHLRRSNGESYGTLTAEPGSYAVGYTERDVPASLYRTDLNCAGDCSGVGYIWFE